MLSSEQRAHDIAVAMLPIVISGVVPPDELDANGNVSRDIMVIYLDTYETVLSSLNKTFPNI